MNGPSAGPTIPVVTERVVIASPMNIASTNGTWYATEPGVAGERNDSRCARHVERRRPVDRCDLLDRRAPHTTVGESVNQEPGHRREAHRISGGGRRRYLAACLGGIGRTDEDRYAELLAEALREADMVDVAVREQQRPDIGHGSSIASSSRQLPPMAAQAGIDQRDRASVLDEIAVDQA